MDTAARFGVWFRPDASHPWRKVGEAPTREEAWRAALAYPLAGDKTVCRPGADPNAEERR